MDAAETRRRIVETVSANGGHLASSLGAVEIAIALARAFDPEKDRIVWDVGHQAYAWKILTGRTWSDAFGAALCGLAENDSRIVALTAGMKDGTGLDGFSRMFPGRFFDVGIAEEHTAAFAARLAAGGLRPVVAVYSTFLQRCVDQIMHDVAIAKLPVVFCVDRAGVVGQDGATHQGLYDIAMLRCLPNVAICQPRDEEDLKGLLSEALGRNGPTVIRYPRGECPAHVPLEEGPRDAKVAVWCTGDWYGKACEVARAVGGVAVHARSIKPFDSELLARERAAGMTIVSLENGSVAGGLGEAIGADMKFGWPDEYIGHGPVEELEVKYSLDAASVAKEITRRLGDSGAQGRRQWP